MKKKGKVVRKKEIKKEGKKLRSFVLALFLFFIFLLKHSNCYYYLY